MEFVFLLAVPAGQFDFAVVSVTHRETEGR